MAQTPVDAQGHRPPKGFFILRVSDKGFLYYCRLTKIHRHNCCCLKLGATIFCGHPPKGGSENGGIRPADHLHLFQSPSGLFNVAFFSDPPFWIPLWGTVIYLPLCPCYCLSASPSLFPAPSLLLPLFLAPFLLLPLSCSLSLAPSLLLASLSHLSFSLSVS